MTSEKRKWYLLKRKQGRVTFKDVREAVAKQKKETENLEELLEGLSETTISELIGARKRDIKG